jgi:hypothetical protein
MPQLFKIKNIYFSILIIGLYIVLNIIYNHVFLTETFFSQWYEGILTRTQIQENFAFVRKWEWAMVLLNALLIIIRITCVAVCLYLGLFFFSNQNHKYNISFNIALKAEIVFVVYAIVRLVWFRFINMPESPEEMQVAPLSLMYFFDPFFIEPWLIYPLNTLNVFEVLYFLMLSALMAVAVQIKFRKAFELVFVSYGAGLLLLMVAQMFLILNNT